MKENKLYKRGLIISFIFFLLLLLALVTFISKSILPSLEEIKNKKILTKETYDTIEKIKLKWINLWDLNSISNTFNKGTYLDNILKNIDQDFYNQHFLNSGKENYETFLKNKKDEINNKTNISIREEKNKKISKILPSYSESYIGLDNEGFLTDFKFINYIESLLETFNLKNIGWSIWIKSIGLVKEESLKNSENNKKEILENSIFFIPLELSLVWNKENMINFLHFVGNVGNLSIKDNELSIEKDNFLRKKDNNIILEWNKYSKSYNIYENQLISIKKIEMREYIDSSYILRKENEKLTDFIKAEQWNEKIEIKIALNFYIKWLKNYQIEESINKFLSIYTTTDQMIKLNLKNKKSDNDKKVLLLKISKYIAEMAWDIKDIKKNVSWKKEDLEKLYKKVLKYDVILYNLNLQNWIYNLVGEVMKNHDKIKSEQTKIINDKTKSLVEIKKARQIIDYLTSIKNDVTILRKSGTENNKNYIERLNNRESYDIIMQLNYGLELNK